MPPTLHRRTVSSPTISPLTTDLLIALLALLIAILVATTTLVVLRRYRRAQKLAAAHSAHPASPTSMPSDTSSESASSYEKQGEIAAGAQPSSQPGSGTAKAKLAKKKQQHRRTNSTIEISFNSSETAGARPSVSSFVYESRLDLIRNSNAPPCDGTNCAQLPELRITFPDEVDEEGVSRGGRVVVVRIGEKGYGLEPLDGGEMQMMETGKILRDK